MDNLLNETTNGSCWARSTMKNVVKATDWRLTEVKSRAFTIGGWETQKADYQGAQLVASDAPRFSNHSTVVRPIIRVGIRRPF